MQVLLGAFLLLALLALASLAYRYYRLRTNLNDLAVQQYNSWRETELGSLREQMTGLARGEAQVQLETWKAGVERQIRDDAVKKSEGVTLGKVTEHFIPYLPEFKFNPKDARFLGSPIDFVVFDGLSEGDVSSVVFVEVKTGRSTLNTRERRVRDAIQDGRVRWLEMRPQFLEAVAAEEPTTD